MKSRTLVVSLGIAALCSALALAKPQMEELPRQAKQEFGWCDWYKGLQEEDCRPQSSDYAACLKQVEEDYGACVKKYGK
ncbi:MAG: hypothetical protein WCV90_01325 [Candidatus Woesearchaeota archaeon]|jgi:hypothetical protein